MTFFNNLDLKYKIFAFNTAILVILFCGIKFIILPSVDQIEQIKIDIYQNQLVLEQKYQRSQSLKKLSANLKSIEGKIENIDQVFISQNRELEFITALEQIAEKKNVRQKIILGKTQSAVGDKFYKKIPLQIQAQGNYPDILQYLQGLEALNYYINIKSIDLSANSVSQRSEITVVNNLGGEVSVNIIADSYWRQ